MSLRNHSEFCSFSAQELCLSLLLSEASPHGRWLCSGVKQSREDWHWIAGSKSHPSVWNMSCTSVVHPSCRFPQKIEALWKINAISLVVTFQAIYRCFVRTCIPVAASGSTNGARGTYQTTSFLIGDTDGVPALISGHCRVYLTLPFLKLVLQHVLILADLNHWNTSRKSRNFCTVIVWCPWFTCILSKLPTFLFSSEELQTPNHTIRYFSKVNFWIKLLG